MQIDVTFLFSERETNGILQTSTRKEEIVGILLNFFVKLTNVPGGFTYYRDNRYF